MIRYSLIFIYIYTMNKYLYILVVLLISAACINASDHHLKPEHKSSILTKFSTEVKYNFVNLDQLKYDWDSLITESYESIVYSPDDSIFYCELKRLCAKLNDGHTYIYKNDNNLRSLPIETKRIDSTIYVTNVYSPVFISKGVKAGTELLEIDGISPFEYAAREILPFLHRPLPNGVMRHHIQHSALPNALYRLYQN